MASKHPAPLKSDELRETVDLLAQVMASMSDRLDSQSAQITELLKLGKAAQNAPSPSTQPATVENLSEGLIGKTILYSLSPIVGKLEEVEENLRSHRNDSDWKMQRLLSQEEATLNRLRKEADNAEWAKIRCRGLAAGCALLGLIAGVGIGFLI